MQIHSNAYALKKKNHVLTLIFMISVRFILLLQETEFF